MACGHETEATRASVPRAPRLSPGSVAVQPLGRLVKISPFPHGEWPGQAGSGSGLGTAVSTPAVESVKNISRQPPGVGLSWVPVSQTVSNIQVQWPLGEGLFLAWMPLLVQEGNCVSFWVGEDTIGTRGGGLPLRFVELKPCLWSPKTEH